MSCQGFDDKVDDLKLKLNDLMGLPLTTVLALDPISAESQETCPLEECVTTATVSHPEILEARAEVEKAEAAVRLATTDIWVPDDAELMLRNRQLPLSEIVAAMGFADQSHLTRHFHRLTGVAPSLIRWNAR